MQVYLLVSINYTLLLLLVKRGDRTDFYDMMMVEAGVSRAVSNILQEGEAIFPTRWVWENGPGDLDGLVVGKLTTGEFVLVALEATHNMDTQYGKGYSTDEAASGSETTRAEQRKAQRGADVYRRS